MTNDTYMAILATMNLISIVIGIAVIWGRFKVLETDIQWVKNNVSELWRQFNDFRRDHEKRNPD